MHLAIQKSLQKRKYKQSMGVVNAEKDYQYDGGTDIGITMAKLHRSILELAGKRMSLK